MIFLEARLPADSFPRIGHYIRHALFTPPPSEGRLLDLLFFPLWTRRPSGGFLHRQSSEWTEKAFCVILFFFRRSFQKASRSGVLLTMRASTF